MILDAIIGLIGSFVACLIQSIAVASVSVVNLIAAGIEAVAGIFVSGFNLRRIERKKENPRTSASAIGGVVILLFVISAIGWFVIPKMMNRTVALVAKDGHSLPFAALIIQIEGENQHKRTDNAGNIVIPRFGANAITVKDPRYVEQTWKHSEIEAELIVERTALGSGLDSLADRLIRPAKE